MTQGGLTAPSSVDNIQAACQRMEDAGYKFQKKLSDGRMRHIAFVLDPDGYWVEVISPNSIEQTETIKETDLETYRMVRLRACGFVPTHIAHRLGSQFVCRTTP
jgi:hypothetical protein